MGRKMQMGTPSEIDPDRLMRAVDASLQAAAEVGSHTGGPVPYPADLMGTADQPECLCDFTRFEIEEACAFLIRAGFLEWSKDT